MTKTESDMVAGLVNSIVSAGPNAIKALGKLGADMLANFKSIFHIASPSQVMHELGTHVSQGLLNGIQAIDVAGAARSHYGSLMNAVGGVLQNRINVSTPGIAAMQAASAQASAASANNQNRLQNITLQLDGKGLYQRVLDHATVQLQIQGIGRMMR